MVRVFKYFLISSMLFFFSASANAEEKESLYSSKSQLSSEEISRLKECKRILQDVDKKSFNESLLAIEKSPYPHENLLLLEAVAQTYDDIVRDQKIMDQRKKEFLFTKVNFNMAYLQLAGANTEQQQDSTLNKMIRRKLRGYLPDSLKEHPDLFHLME